MLPLIYTILLDVDLMFTVLAMLGVQVVVLAGLRALGLPLGWRLACILPAGLLSILAGAIVASRPDLSLAIEQPWVLTASAVSFALGMLLSYLSFPPDYRARAW